MDMLATMFPTADSPSLLMSLVVFAAAATLAFGVMASIRVRTDVKRRTASIAVGPAGSENGARSLRHASQKATQRLIDYANTHFSPTGEGEMRKLRRQLIQAGFLDPRAGPFYFLARIALAIV